MWNEHNVVAKPNPFFPVTRRRSGTPKWLSFTWATACLHAACSHSSVLELLGSRCMQGGAMHSAGGVKSNKLCMKRYILPLRWLA